MSDEEKPKTPKRRLLNPFNQLPQPSKTALRTTGVMTPTSEDSLQNELKRKIPTHRQIKADATPAKTPGRPPLSIITPEQGSKLQRVLVFSEDTALYADIEPLRFEIHGVKLQEALKQIIQETDKFRGKLQGVMPQPENMKQVEARLTTESRQETDLARKKSRKRRIPSQQQVMANREEGVKKMSASTLVDHYFNSQKIDSIISSMSFLSDEEKAAFLIQLKNLSAEWLHLIDHANLGDAAQTQENLVLGGRVANLQMMITEDYEKKALLYNNQTLDVSVSASMLEGTQFCYEITLNIKDAENGHKLSITFNPFTTIKPVVGSIEYFNILQKHLRLKTSKRTIASSSSGSFWDTPEPDKKPPDGDKKRLRSSEESDKKETKTTAESPLSNRK